METGKSAYEQGRVLAGLGRYAQACERFAAAVAQDPDDPEIRAALAAAQRGRGELHAAVESASAALALDPDHRYALRLLALSQSQLATAARRRAERERLRAAAERAAMRAVELGPDEGVNHQVLAAVTMSTDPVRALAAVDRAVELEPQRAQYHLVRARVLRALPGDHDVAADAALRRVLDLDPEHAGALQDLAVADLRARRYDTADERLRQVAAADPERADRVRELLVVNDNRRRRPGAARVMDTGPMRALVHRLPAPVLRRWILLRTTRRGRRVLWGVRIALASYFVLRLVFILHGG